MSGRFKPVRCPECLAEIEVPSDVVEGEVLECPDCGAELEVVRVRDDTVEVQLAGEVGEDWGE